MDGDISRRGSCRSHESPDGHFSLSVMGNYEYRQLVPRPDPAVFRASAWQQRGYLGCGRELVVALTLSGHYGGTFGVRPLSEFASGDDLVPGEKLCWFSAEDGLRTAERLTQPDAAASFSAEVHSDLVRLRDALRAACAEGVRFCLLLREGSTASGHEMDQRKGSFF